MTDRLKLAALVTLTLLTTAAPARAQEAADEGPAVTSDVVYGHKDGMALTFDVLYPTDDSNGAGILYMVSGGWVSRWVAPEVMAGRFGHLLDAGFTVFTIRHGSSPRYKVPEAHSDVDRAVRYVKAHAGEYGVDPDRLGVFGGSAGGHLSLMLGLDSDPGLTDSDDALLREPSDVAAVVAYYPPVDIRPLVGPNERFPALEFDPELAEAISPILYVSSDDPPTLLIHGDADTLVPIRNSEIMYDALQGAGVATEFITIPGAGHGFRGDDEIRARTAMRDWFLTYLVEER